MADGIILCQDMQIAEMTDSSECVVTKPSIKHALSGYKMAILQFKQKVRRNYFDTKVALI